MKFKEIQNLIASRFSGSTFHLIQSDFTDSRFKKLFIGFIKNPRLDLSFADVTYHETEIQVQGVLQQTFLQIDQLRCKLFFTAEGDSFELKIEFNNFPTSWNFGQSFPEWKNTPISALQFFQPTFTICSKVSSQLPPNFQVEWDYTRDSITAENLSFEGLSFKASLSIRQLPNTFNWLLLGSSQQSIDFSGDLEFKNGAPKMLLSSSESWNYEIVEFKFPLKMLIVALLPNTKSIRISNAPISFIRIQSSFNVSTDKKVLPIPISANLSSLQPALIQLESVLNENQNLTFNPVNLLSSLGAEELSDSIPEKISDALNLSLNKVGIDLNTQTKKPNSFYFEISSKNTFSFLNNQLIFSNLKGLTSINFRENDSPNLFLSLAGDVQISNTILQGSLSFPDQLLICQLKENETIQISDVIDTFLPFPINLPDITCTRLYLATHLTNETIDFSCSLSGEKKFRIGNKSIPLKKLNLSLHREKIEEENSFINEVILSGTMEIGEQPFLISTSQTKADAGWFLQGRYDSSPISLNSFLTKLSDTLGVPKFPVPEANLSDLSIQYQTKTKDFEFSGNILFNSPFSIGDKQFETITFISLSRSTNEENGKKEIQAQFETRVQFSSSLLTLQFEIDKNTTSYTGSWQGIGNSVFSISEVIHLFSFDFVPELPFDIHFHKISVTIQKSPDHYQFTGITKEFGEATIQIFKDTLNKWCFELDLKLGTVESLLQNPFFNPLSVVSDYTKQVRLKLISSRDGKPSKIGFQVGIALPAEINSIFGINSKGKPTRKIFKTYDPKNPAHSLIDAEFTKDSNGIQLRLLDSPLVDVNLTNENGKSWIPFDFGKNGAGKIQVPTFQFDEASKSFAASGGFHITKPLSIPFKPIIEFAKSIGLGSIAKLLPDALPIRDINLVKNGKFDFDALNVPSEVKSILSVINGQISKLPDRFKSYLNFNVPEQLSFEIAYGQGVSNLQFKLSVPKGDDPIKILLFVKGGFLGIEIKSILIGEAIRGKLNAMQIDAKIDFFDIPTLLASIVIPSNTLGLLPDMGLLHKTIVAKNLFAISPITPFIPKPLFYDELSIHYLGFEGVKIESAFHFPKPSESPSVIGKLFVEMFKFISDPDYLLDPNKAPFEKQLTYTIGKNYLQTPKYLGELTLGKKQNIASIDVYKNIAHLFNWGKTFRIGELLQSIPLKHRKGKKEFSFAFLNFSANWLLSSREELLHSAYSEIGLSKNEISNFLPSISNSDKEAKKELITLLKGKFDAGFFTIDALYALQLSTAGKAAQNNFKFTGKLIHFINFEFAGSALVQIKEEFFKIGGSVKMEIGSTKILTGTFSLGDEFQYAGQLTLFPSSSPVRINGDVEGVLSKSKFQIEGNTPIKISGKTILNGRCKITKSGAEISGSWLGLTQKFKLSSGRNGIQVCNTTRFSFDLSIDTSLLNSALGSVPGLSRGLDIDLVTVKVKLISTISTSGFRGVVSAKFGLFGKTRSIPSFTITISPKDTAELAEKVGDKVIDEIGNLASDFEQIVSQLAEGLANAAEDRARQAVSLATDAFNQARDIEGTANAIAETTSAAADATVKGLNSSISSIGGKIKRLDKTILSTGKAVLEIGSQATQILSGGFNTIGSGISGIGNQAANIGKSIGNFFGSWF